MYRYLTEALYCGISPKDLGEDFSVSKWNAYVGLSESGMHFLKSAPRVCIISDYEEVKPHLPVDYIETVRSGGRKNKVSKTITRYDYDDPDMDFAPLNSFDGQGLADPTWMKDVAMELGYLKESSASTFICFDMDIQKTMNKTFLIPAIYIWVFTHKKFLRLQNNDGIRTDKVCAEIAKTIDGSRYYGLGELNLTSIKRFSLTDNFQGRVMTFQAQDFNRTSPSGKPIPSNRKHG